MAADSASFAIIMRACVRDAEEIGEAVVGSLLALFADHSGQFTEGRRSAPLWNGASLPMRPQNDREGG